MEMGFFDAFAVVTLGVGEAEEPLFEEIAKYLSADGRALGTRPKDLTLPRSKR